MRDRGFKTPAGSGNRISEILRLLAKVADKLGPENRETRAWMVENSPDPKIARILQDSTLLTMRVVNAIGQLEPVNGITISKVFRIPKGTVSKATRRLIAQKLIKRESLPNNRKEVLFRLTPLGRQLYDVHRAFDSQMERGFMRFLERYDPGQLDFIVRVLQETIETSFLELGGASPSSPQPEPLKP
ncbi:MAG TPA: winged helix DNA-binding protein [Anaerolineales bacterium]|nr:winged helix DNA-binding protein [Anaerolineales bacterium]